MQRWLIYQTRYLSLSDVPNENTDRSWYTTSRPVYGISNFEMLYVKYASAVSGYTLTFNIDGTPVHMVVKPVSGSQQSPDNGFKSTVSTLANTHITNGSDFSLTPLEAKTLKNAAVGAEASLIQTLYPISREITGNEHYGASGDAILVTDNGFMNVVTFLFSNEYTALGNANSGFSYFEYNGGSTSSPTLLDKSLARTAMTNIPTVSKFFVNKATLVKFALTSSGTNRYAFYIRTRPHQLNSRSHYVYEYEEFMLIKTGAGLQKLALSNQYIQEKVSQSVATSTSIDNYPLLRQIGFNRYTPDDFSTNPATVLAGENRTLFDKLYKEDPYTGLYNNLLPVPFKVATEHRQGPWFESGHRLSCTEAFWMKMPKMAVNDSLILDVFDEFKLGNVSKHLWVTIEYDLYGVPDESSDTKRYPLNSASGSEGIHTVGFYNSPIEYESSIVHIDVAFNGKLKPVSVWLSNTGEPDSGWYPEVDVRMPFTSHDNAERIGYPMQQDSLDDADITPEAIYKGKQHHRSTKFPYARRNVPTYDRNRTETHSQKTPLYTGRPYKDNTCDRKLPLDDDGNVTLSANMDEIHDAIDSLNVHVLNRIMSYDKNTGLVTLYKPILAAYNYVDFATNTLIEKHRYVNRIHISKLISVRSTAGRFYQDSIEIAERVPVNGRKFDLVDVPVTQTINQLSSIGTRGQAQDSSVLSASTKLKNASSTNVWAGIDGSVYPYGSCLTNLNGVQTFTTPIKLYREVISSSTVLDDSTTPTYSPYRPALKTLDGEFYSMTFNNTWTPINTVAERLPGIRFKGDWDANTNTPTLTNGSGTEGDVYRVSVAGSFGGYSFVVNTYAIYTQGVYVTWDNIAYGPLRTYGAYIFGNDVKILYSKNCRYVFPFKMGTGSIFTITTPSSGKVRIVYDSSYPFDVNISPNQSPNLMYGGDWTSVGPNKVYRDPGNGFKVVDYNTAAGGFVTYCPKISLGTNPHASSALNGIYKHGKKIFIKYGSAGTVIDVTPDSLDWDSANESCDVLNEGVLYYDTDNEEYVVCEQMSYTDPLFTKLTSSDYALDDQGAIYGVSQVRINGIFTDPRTASLCSRTTRKDLIIYGTGAAYHWHDDPEVSGLNPYYDLSTLRYMSPDIVMLGKTVSGFDNIGIPWDQRILNAIENGNYSEFKFLTSTEENRENFKIRFISFPATAIAVPVRIGSKYESPQINDAFAELLSMSENLHESPMWSFARSLGRGIINTAKSKDSQIELLQIFTDYCYITGVRPAEIASMLAILSETPLPGSTNATLREIAAPSGYRVCDFFKHYDSTDSDSLSMSMLATFERISISVAIDMFDENDDGSGRIEGYNITNFTIDSSVHDKYYYNSANIGTVGTTIPTGKTIKLSVGSTGLLLTAVNHSDTNFDFDSVHVQNYDFKSQVDDIGLRSKYTLRLIPRLGMLFSVAGKPNVTVTGSQVNFNYGFRDVSEQPNEVFWTDAGGSNYDATFSLIGSKGRLVPNTLTGSYPWGNLGNVTAISLGSRDWNADGSWEYRHILSGTLIATVHRKSDTTNTVSWFEVVYATDRKTLSTLKFPSGSVRTASGGSFTFTIDTIAFEFINILPLKDIYVFNGIQERVDPSDSDTVIPTTYDNLYLTDNGIMITSPKIKKTILWALKCIDPIIVSTPSIGSFQSSLVTKQQIQTGIDNFTL